MARAYKKDKTRPDWWIDYKDVHGRRRREKVGPNRDTALKVLGERLKEVTLSRELGVRTVEKITVKAFADKFINDYAKPNKLSWERDRYTLQTHFLPRFGNRFMSEVTGRDLERFKAERSRKVKKSTVNRELDTLKTMFRKAWEWGNVRENVAGAVKKFRVDNRRLVYLEKDEIAALLSACSPRFRPVVEAFILTGMRRGELLGLRWRDVDLKNGVIHLLKTKSGKARQVPINSRLRSVLSALPRHIASDYVFCQPDGKAWRDLRGSLTSAVKASGIEKNVTFHTLRHTFASQLAMAGVSLYTISELLGHSSVETTQIYAHLSPNHKRQAVEKLAAELSACEPESKTV